MSPAASSDLFPLCYDHTDGWIRRGRVLEVRDGSVVVRLPSLTRGAVVSISRPDGVPLLAEVCTIDGGGAGCRPLGSVRGLAVGAIATSTRATLGSFVGDSLLGCAVDGWGRTAWGSSGSAIAVTASCCRARTDRALISRSLRTGVSAIDCFATLGHGQRIALFAGAGVGKSTLLRRIVAQADVDARVVALIGERSREATETGRLLRDSGSWRTTTLVCATAESSAAERCAAAVSATAQAEHLAAGGRRVLLVMDSLTRVAAAWRELALAGGEPAAHRGYPPSVVAVLADLVERAGAFQGSSITAVYAVLVDGDDPFEPVTDAVRGLLDGHITLSRRLADAGRYPAVDVLRSLSRTMPAVVGAAHRADAALVRRSIDALERAEDLLAIGAYQPGGDALLDAAVAVRGQIEALIFDDDVTATQTTPRLGDVADVIRTALPGLADRKA
ncbi:MAG: EscN/YscN/HrcN family type III secretion system ATPase [Candidatus Eremiobacteraeota bacterium]|nr:EscN/YscN/HrcN family type III secretion system ATPase [Candidatus Eremiobacteraeota bacterium]MBC5827029.1 EscN/YscN/HrcN family type III secretion system ATPase [Candidatus Eremiobacteraeota bacterium]